MSFSGAFLYSYSKITEVKAKKVIDHQIIDADTTISVIIDNTEDKNLEKKGE